MLHVHPADLGAPNDARCAAVTQSEKMLAAEQSASAEPQTACAR